MLDIRSPNDRFEAVRQWIREGRHNAPEVAEAVARRILDAGDLDDAASRLPSASPRRSIH